MGELYLPPGARPRRWARVEAGNKALDGRVLNDYGPIGLPSPHVGQARAWQTADRLRVIASVDQTPHGDLLHVSVSYRDRDPSWKELVAVKLAFFGDDVDAMMLCPSKEDYVNVHEHTFHWYQTPVTWGIQ